MRRRRMLISLVLMLVIGSWIAWRITHRHDPRFVGKWLLTRGAVPTAEELSWTRDRSQAGDRIEWTFDADGTGRQFSEQRISGRSWAGIAAFTWSTDGECVSLEWGDPQQGWAAVRATVNELRRVIRGDSSRRPPDVYAYSVAEETDAGTRQFVLQYENAAHVRTDDVYCLTRFEDE